MSNSPSSDGRRILAVIGFLWAAAIVAAYYVSHKPFDPALAMAAALLARDLLIGASILALSGGLGRRLLSQGGLDPLFSAALEAALGLGLLSLVWLTAGALRLYEAWAAWVILLLGIAALRREVLLWVREVIRVRERFPKRDYFALTLAFLSASLLMLSLAEAAAEPVKFDALVYHLALPETFVSQGQLVFTPDNPFWGFPLGASTLYTWSRLLARPEAAAVLGWMIGVICLLGVMGAASAWGVRVSWVAVAALLAGETTAASLGWAYADWLAALFGVSLLAALALWHREPSMGRVVLAGAMAGFAVGAKYTAAIAVIGGVVAIISRKGFRQGPRPALAFGLAAVLAFSPWLLKNLLGAGAPLFPYLATGESAALRSGFYRGLPTDPNALSALLTPLRATLFGMEGAPGHAASIGPLLLGLLPGVIFLERSQPTLRPHLSLLAVGWVGWSVAGLYSELLGQTRLYMVVFPAWAVLAAGGYAGFQTLSFGQVRIARLVSALVVLGLTFSAVGAAVAALRTRPLAAALALESEAGYLSRRLGYYEPAMKAVVKVGDGSSVIMLWEPRSLHCLPACRPDAWLDRWFLERSARGEPGSILSAWRDEGASHVLLYRAGMNHVREHDPRYQTEDWLALEQMLGSLALMERFGDIYELYAIPP